MPKSARNNALVRPRIQLGDAVALGPGKIDLLRAIGEMRSISGAARRLGIAYKRAWLLIDTLNQGFGRPVVTTATGGKGGGGARLTPLGEQIVLGYDALERRINESAQAEVAALRRLLR
ncbi:MAG: LysR family transcriptional regulator [Sulfuritalea sp.]|nr:LysR family transcriptional regulator [Sulfuritalea sp.]